MSSPMFTLSAQRLLINSRGRWKFLRKTFSTTEGPTKDSEATAVKDKLGGFAKAFERHRTAGTKTEHPDNQTFAHLFRHSKFVDLGDPRGKVVTGTVFHVVNDDLYIDFGWKFHCVCPRPTKNGNDYVRGSKVRLKIKHLELSTKFLGYEKDLTLLEADCTLLGLISTPLGSVNRI